MSKRESNIPTIIIVIVIIVLLLLFITSLGKFNPSNIGKIPDEYKDSKEEAKRKHKKLSELIAKQEALNIKLNKKFKQIYFFVRIGMVLLWFGLLSLFYFFGVINNLGDVLNYSEASILILLILNFITFGTITDLKNFIDIIKIKTENWVYGKYAGIENKIETNKEQLTLLEREIRVIPEENIL